MYRYRLLFLNDSPYFCNVLVFLPLFFPPPVPFSQLRHYFIPPPLFSKACISPGCGAPIGDFDAYYNPFDQYAFPSSLLLLSLFAFINFFPLLPLPFHPRFFLSESFVVYTVYLTASLAPIIVFA